MTKVKAPTRIEVQSVGDELADAIIALSQASQGLEASHLSQRTIILLLRDATGLSMSVIKRVLDALPNLARWYTKP